MAYQSVANDFEATPDSYAAYILPDSYSSIPSAELSISVFQQYSYTAVWPPHISLHFAATPFSRSPFTSSPAVEPMTVHTYEDNL